MVSTTPYQEQRRVMVVTEARQAEDGSAHRMVIAANELSRNGDELNLRGISFKNYRKNPVVLWAHDAYEGIPIAKTVKIGHDEQGRIVADFEFNSDDEFAARVENAWNGGFIRAASIRYMPTKVVEVRNEDGSVDRLRVEGSDLLEWSLVPVPADPDSVRAAARAMNLPAEIFRGFEPEPEPLPETVTEEPEPEPVVMESEPAPGLEAEPNQDDPIEALRERVDALEQELRELAARDSTTEAEPQESQKVPESDPEDPMLAAIGAQFAAMRQIMEEK